MNLQEKPPLLSAALMLSLAGSSLGLLAYLAAALFYRQSLRLIGQLTDMLAVQKVSQPYFFLFALLYALSLLGVLNMCRSRKTGYFLYAGAQSGLLLVPLFQIGTDAFSMTNTLFTLLFLTIYSVYLGRFR
ncbi:MAG: hypothetical protein AB7D05_09045 [Mangrovibacterium sp.]